MTKYFGSIDGIDVGRRFKSREELRNAGIHAPPIAGISGTAAEGADSIVLSGGYTDDVDLGSVVIYTGHGGRRPGSRRQAFDQTFESPGNAGLVASQLRALPVRVTRGDKLKSAYAPDDGYEYAGLYAVEDHWMEVGLAGFLVARFRLVAIAPRPITEDVTDEEELEYRESFTMRRVRDSAMSKALKAEYGFACQICGTSVVSRSGDRYSEGAHIRPLGNPHHGRDARSNLLSLCPNHHAQLDLGGMIIRDDLTVVVDESSPAFGAIRLLPSHEIDAENLRYHRRHWAGQPLR